jgi:hypothetical protein
VQISHYNSIPRCFFIIVEHASGYYSIHGNFLQLMCNYPPTIRFPATVQKSCAIIQSQFDPPPQLFPISVHISGHNPKFGCCVQFVYKHLAIVRSEMLFTIFAQVSGHNSIPTIFNNFCTSIRPQLGISPYF